MPTALEAVIEYSKELKLPMIRKHIEEYVQEAMQQDISYEEFLAHLLQKECDARREASRYNRIRLAEFTHKKYLEDLVVGDLPQMNNTAPTGSRQHTCFCLLWKMDPDTGASGTVPLHHTARR
ncbi:ATP-binding protein [Effusibacillus pohliae]|uniref:ATP-binding protein n=1 Tax=Effusibacillus pohliae TaxID=232270 RepID=UPI000365172F|nr:ATP-binding protein [Effusibacillus pohliae]